jgi:IS605 OrfB family transposase
MDLKSNHDVVYSCEYHAIWCPKYRRPVLVDGVDERLKTISFREGQRRLRRAQRTVSRRKHGSKRRAKAARKAAVVHRKLADQRRDFQHQLGTKIVGRYAAVCVEDLSLSGLARTKLAKSFGDAAFGEFFRQLKYKCPRDRKHFIAVDRFFPPSRMCNVCGALNDRLTLSDRERDCDRGAHHGEGFPRRVHHPGRRTRDARRRTSRGAETLREAVSDPACRAVVGEPRIPRL